MRKTYKPRKTNKRKRRGGGVEEDNLVNLEDPLEINKTSDPTNPFAIGVTTPAARKNELDKMERQRQNNNANKTRIATEEMKKSIKNNNM